jgi:uncharacterized phage-associated protein
MAFDALTIANAFIDISKKKPVQTPLTPMKLLKLVYLAHGWHLGVKRQPLINGPVEAWQYGPVIPDIYHAVKHIGNSAISNRLKNHFGEPPELASNGNPEIDSLIAWIWDEYGHLSGVALSNGTHLPGTPWSTVVNRYGGVRNVPRGTDIPEELMQDHFYQQSQQLTRPS